MVMAGVAGRTRSLASFAQVSITRPTTRVGADDYFDGSPAPAGASEVKGLKQLSAMSLDLDAVRQNIDRITTTQEQITRSVAQLTAGQEQMTREITKLQAVEQYVLYKNSEPPPRPAPALMRNLFCGRRPHADRCRSC